MVIDQSLGGVDRWLCRLVGTRQIHWLTEKARRCKSFLGITDPTRQNT